MTLDTGILNLIGGFLLGWEREVIVEIKVKKKNKILCSSRFKEPTINKVNKPINSVNALIIHCTNFCKSSVRFSFSKYIPQPMFLVVFLQLSF